MPDVVLTRHDRTETLGMIDELADLYITVYAEPPYNGAPKFSRDRFVSRTRDQTGTVGFSLAAARDTGRLIGFTFGFTMTAGRWWAHATPPPAEVLAAEKFAVVELIVAAEHRSHGVGSALAADLLRDRAERYATLAAVIGADAYGWYLRHGWTKVGEFRVEPPFSDALALDLRT